MRACVRACVSSFFASFLSDVAFEPFDANRDEIESSTSQSQLLSRSSEVSARSCVPSSIPLVPSVLESWPPSISAHTAALASHPNHLYTDSLALALAPSAPQGWMTYWRPSTSISIAMTWSP